MTTRIKAHVQSMTPLTNTILKLILVPEVYQDYQAGQYLQIASHDTLFSYSIANAPLGSQTYELHLRHSRDNSQIEALLTEIQQSRSVRLQMPLGQCHINRLDPLKPILFIAGGTGFSPIKAMIEQLLHNKEPRPFELFWTARSQEDLYLHEQLAQWEEEIPHFHYVAYPSEHHKKSMIQTLLEKHHHDLAQWQYVISGPFDMVYALRTQLMAQGIARDALFSDAFEGETS